MSSGSRAAARTLSSSAPCCPPLKILRRWFDSSPAFRGRLVTVEIKFCGLTRPEDARHAVSLGASYVGVIFASGPRLVTADHAATVLEDVPPSVRRVGVFATQSAREIGRIVDIARLDV